MAAVLIPVGAIAQTASAPFNLIGLKTESPVVIDGAGPAGFHSDGFQKVAVDFICVSFHNSDPRTATSFRVNFVYYDAMGMHVGGDFLDRSGTFSTDVRIKSYDERTRNANRENCVSMHYPKTGVSLVVYYVDHVDFADGTPWKATLSPIPETLPNYHPARTTPRPRPTFDPLATTTELAPVIQQTYPDCATAAGIAHARTPLLSGLADVPIDPQHNEFIWARTVPGTERDGKIGFAYSVCGDSPNDKSHESAALKLVSTRTGGVSPGVYRVYFPLLTVGRGCWSEVRLLAISLVLEPFANDVPQRVRSATAIASARVTIGSDGKPTDAVLSHDSGNEVLNQAVVKSALASRYWPEIVNGQAVPGTTEFPIVWSTKKTSSTIDVENPGDAKPIPPAVQDAPKGC